MEQENEGDKASRVLAMAFYENNISPKVGFIVMIEYLCSLGIAWGWGWEETKKNVLFEIENYEKTNKELMGDPKYREAYDDISGFLRGKK